jgi:hypothetical protein
MMIPTVMMLSTIFFVKALEVKDTQAS